jgi:hypothetical protein
MAKTARAILSDRSPQCLDYCQSRLFIISLNFLFTSTRLNEADACICGSSMVVFASSGTHQIQRPFP